MPRWCSLLTCGYFCARPLAGPPENQAGSTIALDPWPEQEG